MAGKYKRSFAIGAIAAFTLGAPANAATNTASFTVTANITAYCTVTISTGITGLSVTTPSGSTTMIVSCTNGTGWTVGLVGTHQVSDTQFAMSDGTDTIYYTIAATSAAAGVTQKPVAVGSLSHRWHGT